MMGMKLKDYAAREGVSVGTVERWCKNMLLPEGKRNRRLPAIVCRKRGRDWRIDAAESERIQLLTSGNTLVRDLARAGRKA